ncbi:MAG: four helix bundle protein [Alteromonadaceae bacterium]
MSADLYKYFKDCKDYGFRDQITRSGLSIPSNIAEGMARSSDKEKRYFINLAMGSCAELCTQIYIAIDIGYIESSLGKEWIKKTKHTGAMLTGLKKSLEKSKLD